MLEIFKFIEKLDFNSQSLPGSEMDWNYTGYGKTEVIQKENGIYFIDNIIVGKKLHISDEKLWIFNKRKLEFWHKRNLEFEKIFVFSIIKRDEKTDYREFEQVLMSEPDCYMCGKDIYTGSVLIKKKEVIFSIEIKSETKNEKITYRYY